MESACQAPHFEDLKLRGMRMDVRAAVDREPGATAINPHGEEAPRGRLEPQAGEREDDQGHIEA